MDKICENCKYWLQGYKTWLPQHEDRWIKSKNQDFGMCLSGKFKYTVPSNVPVNGVCYQDGEDCQASLRTGRKFGCIHFERK